METKRRKSGGRRPVLLLLVGCFTVILVLWLVYVLSVFKTFAWLTAKQETAVVEKSSISLPPSLEARILRPGAGLVDDARRMLETADIAAATGDPGLLSDVFNMAKNLAMDLIEREQRFQLEVDATRAATAAALALEKSAAALIASNKPVNLDKMGSVIDPLDPQRLYTQQTTYLGGDEAEVSVFDNLLCFDGRSPIVTMDNPIRNPDRILDYTHACEYRQRAGCVPCWRQRTLGRLLLLQSRATAAPVSWPTVPLPLHLHLLTTPVSIPFVSLLQVLISVTTSRLPLNTAAACTTWLVTGPITSHCRGCRPQISRCRCTGGAGGRPTGTATCTSRSCIPRTCGGTSRSACLQRSKGRTVQQQQQVAVVVVPVV